MPTRPETAATAPAAPFALTARPNRGKETEHLEDRSCSRPSVRTATQLRLHHCRPPSEHSAADGGPSSSSSIGRWAVQLRASVSEASLTGRPHLTPPGRPPDHQRLGSSGSRVARGCGSATGAATGSSDNSCPRGRHLCATGSVENCGQERRITVCRSRAVRLRRPYAPAVAMTWRLPAGLAFPDTQRARFNGYPCRRSTPSEKAHAAIAASSADGSATSSSSRSQAPGRSLR